MYLTTEDLNTFLDEREIAAIKRDYEADQVDKIPVGISYAENYVKDRLCSRYNMEIEYGKPLGEKSSTLMEIIAHLAIWKLAATFPTVQLDGKRHFNYQTALDNLELIAKGKLLTSLPTLRPEQMGNAAIYGQSTETDVIY
jgi:hypothetical protein